MKMVGPFVLMIYKIIVGDLLRFFLIYGVFVVGFSQGKTSTVNTQMSAAALIFSATVLLRRLFVCGALLSAALIFQTLFCCCDSPVK